MDAPDVIPSGRAKLGRWTAASVFVSLIGCGLLPNGPTPAERADVSAARVLNDLVDVVSGHIELSGERIANETEDLDLARLSVHYRMRLVRDARITLGYRDPHVGLLDLWALCRQLEDFLTSGEGADLFGPLQPIAIEAAQSSAQRVAEQADRLFRDSDLAEARRIVARFTSEHPIREGFARVGLQDADFDIGGDGNTKLWRALSLEWINPLSGFGSNITEGAEAMGAAMDRFTTAAEFLPRQLGWQLELFVYDLAGSKPLEQVSQGVARTAASVDEVVQIADRLPQRLREEVTAALQGLEGTLTGVRRTLEEVRASAQPVADVGEQYATTARSIDAMAEELEGTFRKFDGTYRMLTNGDESGDPATEAAAATKGIPREAAHRSAAGGGADGEEAAEHKRPFHILDWNRTATSIDEMCEELQRTLDEFQLTLADPQLEAVLQRAQRVADGAIASAVLSFVAGGAALIVLGFLAVWLLRTLTRPHVRHPTV